MQHRVSLFALALAVGLAGCAMGAPNTPAGVQTGKTELGTVLTDANGMTLYVFDKDVAGKSNCAGKCAENWPPLAAAGDDKAVGAFTVIVRDDGSRQWTYQGKPLYRWVKDEKPGDTTGHGFRDVWRVATPARSGGGSY